MTQLAWNGRDSRVRPETVGASGPYRQIALSPSDRRVAIHRGEAIAEGAAGDIWVMDLATGVLSRVTNDPALDSDPSWSPDERSMVFTTNRTGRATAFRKDFLTGMETPLVDHPDAVVVDEWTPDPGGWKEPGDQLDYEEALPVARHGILPEGGRRVQARLEQFRGTLTSTVATASARI